MRVKLHPVGRVDVSIRQSPPFWVIKKKSLVIKCAESPLAAFKSVEDVHVACNPSVRLVVLFGCLELFDVVGVSKRASGRIRNPLRAMLVFGCASCNVGDRDIRIHLRSQSNKLEDRVTTRLILHFADNLLIRFVEGKVCARQSGQVVECRVCLEVRVDLFVRRIDLVHERVGVSEEELRTITPLLLDLIVVEAIHVQFREVQDSAADVEGLVDDGFDFHQLNRRQILREDSIAGAVRLLDQLLALAFGLDESDIGALELVLDRLAIHRVDHNFKKVLFKVVGRLQSRWSFSMSLVRLPVELS